VPEFLTGNISKKSLYTQTKQVCPPAYREFIVKFEVKRALKSICCSKRPQGASSDGLANKQKI